MRERDVCWEYCDKLEGNKVRCRFCTKVLNGGISRLKFHLSQIPSKGVNPCTKVRDDVVDHVKAIIAAKEEHKEVQLLKQRHRVDDPSSAVHPATKRPRNNVPAGPVVSSLLLVTPAAAVADDDDDLGAEPSAPAAVPNKLVPGSGGGGGGGGPTTTTNRAPRSSSSTSALDAERCVAEFFFENKLEYSVADTISYRNMMEALGGQGFRGPSSDTLREKWLHKLKSEVLHRTKEIERDWVTTGCTILADSWTDNKLKALVNFSVSSPLGTFFLKTVDASQHFKTHRGLYDLFDEVIREVGPENVVQIITDRNINYGNVDKLIMQNYNSIFWSPCASFCINSMLDDFSKIDWVNQCICQAQNVTRFIYNNEWVLDLMRNKCVSGTKDLVCSGITKPVSDFLTLQSLLRHRSKLKQMFHSPEYSSSSYANRALSISCVGILEDDELWRAVEEIAAVSEPLLRVMRDVSGGKAAIGCIYESMTKVMDSIRTYYIMDECKCKSFLDIVEQRWQAELHSPLHSAAAYLNPSIQYNPEVKFFKMIKEEVYHVLYKVLTTPDQRQDITSQLHSFCKAQGLFGSNIAKEARSNASPGMWWEQYGDSAPSLQRAAVRITSQVCSTLTFQRDWSVILQSHNEKRNKLDKEALADAAYVHYNLTLHHSETKVKKQRSDGDPIALADIDMTSPWVEDCSDSPNLTQWLDRFPSALDGGDLNTRQFSGSIFGANDNLFGL